MIDNKYFNEDHPENHTVRMRSMKNKMVEISKNNKWVPESLNLTTDRMINHSGNEIICTKFKDIEPTVNDVEKIYQIQNINSENRKFLKEAIHSRLIHKRERMNDVATKI